MKPLNVLRIPPGPDRIPYETSDYTPNKTRFMTVLSEPMPLYQTPIPGTRILLHRGDIIHFSLTLDPAQRSEGRSWAGGNAWIRTNIGRARITRQEVIREVENKEPPLGRDWFDIPLRAVDERCFEGRLGLTEVGHFEAKCFFLPQGATEPLWPEGPNVEINVSPARTCCANMIYNAFVRQFGPNKKGQFQDTVRSEQIHNLDQAGYHVIPPSGTFRDLIRELDFIAGELGCRIIQLLPIHPTPTTYGRMGRFGSPYAALSFTEVDPGLAQFDPRATPLDQFMELMDAVHTRNMRLLMDIAINHTGWAASLHAAHPEWLARDQGGEIQVPGAWGVQWEDLTRLDYTHTDLWQYMAGVFLTWCRRGVNGFRCDAAYMIPVSAWRYIIAAVRDQFPDTVFFLEGLGGKRVVTQDLLNRGNFDWAYSELFQHYDRAQIQGYLPEALEVSARMGLMVHFAETHDNNRLASVSIPYARMRTLLCALLSPQGAFGFANGVEWFATEKIQVHEANSLNWGAEVNQVALIHRISRLLRAHPAFHDQVDFKMVHREEGNHMAVWRGHRPSKKWVLILINLDTEKETLLTWETTETHFAGEGPVDLLTGKIVEVHTKGHTASATLGPGEVLCLTPVREDLALIAEQTGPDVGVPARIVAQQMRAKVLDIYGVYQGKRELGDFDPDEAVKALQEDPVALCGRLNPRGSEPRVTRWEWPRDLYREVMVPPGHFLMIHGDVPFEARILNQDRVLAREEALPRTDGTFFALFSPLPVREDHFSGMLKLSVYDPGGCRHVEAPLLFLAPWHTVRCRRYFGRHQIHGRPLLMLGTNGRGGMLRAHARWGELHSRYDALLAGNLDPEIPRDRWIMFTRCRAWLVYEGYSQALGAACLHSFSLMQNGQGVWRFQVPTGQGEHVWLTLGLEMIVDENAVRLLFYRPPGAGSDRGLADSARVRLILRPDLEDRSFHDITKAYTGPEQDYPKQMAFDGGQLVFSPDENRRLSIHLSPGIFVWEPEWAYMIYRDNDAGRGMDPDSDLFSPGYFTASLQGGETLELVARINASVEVTLPPSDLPKAVQDPHPENSSTRGIARSLQGALRDFVVRRGPLKSVIAGYPWFLDWGRDALIVVRGLIAAGRLDEAKAVLKQFGRFEQNGTLPNMIHGEDAGNRDTSDAPLWYVVCCKDWVRTTGDRAFLEEPCGRKTIRETLVSIVRAYVEGTPNGVKMDPGSGLVFSPAHFTWMDTQHPAGTPREGYPVEIQALWFAALAFLTRIDPVETDRWHTLGQQVCTALMDLFWMEGPGYLADCIHARSGSPPEASGADDALRPNQLFAVTLGAVTDAVRCRKILTACEELLVPGAIRSLADRPVKCPLEIRHQGRRLNDPHHPYWGTYTGDEDTERKPAYHNGTAWTWPFAAFCEAWAMVYGRPGKQTALSLLASTSKLMDEGCVGQVPEIVDGNYPHTQRGCDAQAWGASEVLRVWMKLTQKN